MVDKVVLSFSERALKYLFNRPSSGWEVQFWRIHKRRAIPTMEIIFLGILPPSCTKIISFSKFYFVFKQKSKSKNPLFLKKFIRPENPWNLYPNQFHPQGKIMYRNPKR
jgi:hypothetical protein